MKKALYFLSVFLFLIVFISTKNISVSFTNSMNNVKEEDVIKEYEVYFKNLRSTEIYEAFKDLDIVIKEIEAEKIEGLSFTYYMDETKGLKDNVALLTKNYRNYLISKHKEEEAFYFVNKGFLISKMKIECLNKNLEKLKSKVEIIKYK